MAMNGLMMSNTGALMKDDMVPLRKSANITESVPVPSSEHVAEIVGRQGCKIKALRAKTNTYIKTPVRDEDPVFVVTGRREDVLAAKTEILSAAEHFSQIRAARRPGGVGPGSPNIPGQVKINVPVPYRVVGLLVGSKGATIKKIQQKTSTYIVTPSREKEPMFEVTGQEENVYQARALMYYHIFERTGQLCDPKSMGDMGSNLQDLNNPDILREYQKSLPQFNSLGGDSMYEDPMSALAALNSLNGAFMNTKPTDFNLQNAIKTMNMTRSMLNNSTPIATTTPTNGLQSHVPDALQLPVQGLKQTSVDEGISLSPPMTSSTCFWSTDDGKGTGIISGLPMNNKACHLQRKSSNLSNVTNFPFPPTQATTSSVTADKFLPTTGYPTLASSTSTQSRGMASELGYNSLSALTSALVPLTLSGGASSAADSVAGSLVSTPDTSPLTGINSHFTQDNGKKYCLVCLKNEVTGAFLPCGHNHFCTDCAELVLKKSDLERKCPYCQEPAHQFFKIYT